MDTCAESRVRVPLNASGVELGLPNEGEKYLCRRTTPRKTLPRSIASLIAMCLLALYAWMAFRLGAEA